MGIASILGSSILTSCIHNIYILYTYLHAGPLTIPPSIPQRTPLYLTSCHQNNARRSALHCIPTQQIPDIHSSPPYESTSTLPSVLVPYSSTDTLPDITLSQFPSSTTEQFPLPSHTHTLPYYSLVSVPLIPSSFF
jgi:hypothetical protein